MTDRTAEAGDNGTLKVLRWIIVALKLLIMLVLLVAFSPFIILWFFIREASYRTSLRRGMKQAGADDEAVKELGGAFPGIRRIIESVRK